MESSFTFLRVRGIAIGANWTWLAVFALTIWSLGAGIFPRTYPGLEPATALAMAVVTAMLFFGSILLHELGHAFRALKEGMRIEGITLWLFGGVARFSGTFPSPGAEFRIAIAGPLVSVGLAAGFGAISVASAALGWPDMVRGVVEYLARINAILVAFNLVPALPLDGGRVLRSWLWHRQGSFLAATRSAARAGRAFGLILIAVGLLGTFTGAGTGGLWFVFLGWFLLQAAQAEAAMAQLQSAFSGLRVRDVMTPNPVIVPASTSLPGFLHQAEWYRHSTYPVVDDEDGRLVGLVSLRLAAARDPERRAGATVADVMLPVSDVAVVDRDAALLEAVEELRKPPGRAVALDEGRVAGILSMSDVGRALELAELRGEREEPARSAGLLPWVVVALLMAIAASLLYHPPVLVIAPGETADVAGDITIRGAEVSAVSGRYLLTSVSLSQRSALFTGIAVVRTDEDVVPASSVIPRGVDPDRFVVQQRRLFSESQRLAAGAAARAAGMHVDVTGTGARVVAILPSGPSADALRAGDVILALDGRPVGQVDDLRSIVRSRPAGTVFDVSFERGGQTRRSEVRSSRLGSGAEETVGIGVYVETRDFDVRLPFEIEFRTRDIGGPSAGLAYALAILDLLDAADIAGGRSVAATGTIGVDGQVGAVGGVEEKAIAARRSGAEVFLVPSEELDEARADGLEVRGVNTLQDAIRSLAGPA